MNLLRPKKKPTPEILRLDFPNCIARDFPDVFPAAWSAVEILGQGLSDLDTSALERHSPGLKGYDWQSYLRCSVARVVRVLHNLSRTFPASAHILDYGSYFGNFSIAASLLGFHVDAADFYRNAGDTFQPTVAEFSKRKVGVIDLDDGGPTVTDIGDDSYDAVLCMSVIEHIPHTPRFVLEAVNRVLKPGGLLILDTPNLAYIYKRKQLLRGESVFPGISQQFHAEIPFTGHHREYTQAEVEWMLRAIGQEVVSVETFSYSMYSIEYLANEDLENFRIMEKDPSCRELIFSVSRKMSRPA